MKTKLVRDKIPQIILDKTHKKADYYIAEKQEYEKRLFEKMFEELAEFKENPCIEEAADMLEVLIGLADHFGRWDIGDIYCETIRKRKSRGGFQNRVVLVLDNKPPEEEENDWNVTAFGEQK